MSQLSTASLTAHKNPSSHPQTHQNLLLSALETQGQQRAIGMRKALTPTSPLGLLWKNPQGHQRGQQDTLPPSIKPSWPVKATTLGRWALLHIGTSTAFHPKHF